MSMCWCKSIDTSVPGVVCVHTPHQFEKVVASVAHPADKKIFHLCIQLQFNSDEVVFVWVVDFYH